ncbi:sensor histidine kinase KdpD [Chitinibacter sp. GC72]|uniref:sensor histidine kinase n=1 Tax=Chitinibacter sp. GC72 TaxID=1526917 RepID=UPI0012F9F75B|nr:HAMP domain-containing sensor histidine kinase [Chitinibacter sp. GC72]
MHKMSLRRRMTLVLFMVSCCSLLALAASLLMSAEESEEALIDEVVNTALNRIESQWPIQGSIVLPQNLEFYHAPIGQLPPGLPAEVASLAVGNSEYYEQSHEFHVGIREYGGERLYVLYDTARHEERLATIYLGVGVAVVVLALLAGVIGHVLAGTILKQLSALAQAVEHDRPLPLDAAHDDEVSVLAQAIHAHRLEKAQLLQREREFTAHAGHELRTPLTRIRTSAELLRELSALSAADLQRVQQIEAAADEMQARLSALLFLARDLHASQLQRLNLHAAVAESLQQFAAQKGEIVRSNRIAAQLMIDADPALLKMLLDNLLSNALRYTQSGQIVIDWQDGVLTIADTGVGIADNDLHRVQHTFERASPLPDGFGLGLAIVGRICAALGWEWRIDSQPGQGTRVQIGIAAKLALAQN